MRIKCSSEMAVFRKDGQGILKKKLLLSLGRFHQDSYEQEIELALEGQKISSDLNQRQKCF